MYLYKALQDSLCGVHFRKEGEVFEWETPPEKVGPNLEYLPPPDIAPAKPAPVPPRHRGQE